jgi:lipid-A-disaccharide synthase
MSQRIFFSVGEASGDQHAARLIRALRARQPRITCRGFGGPAMRSAGLQSDFDLTKLAVMGIVEVIPKLRQFFKLAADAKRLFATGQIDQVVLVDFPGFNWHIAKHAKRYGIPVTYYCPPQLWAWAPWRLRKVRRWVDQVLCVLPFEYQWYRSRGVAASYVGHPFFDAVHESSLDPTTLNHLSRCGNERPLVALLPGSRGHEVTSNWPLLVAAAARVHERFPIARFAVGAYKDSQAVWCREALRSHPNAPPMEFFVGRTSEVIESAHCAMMVSGSISLELMARQTPAAVVYRMGRVFAAVAKTMVRLPSFTLPNLIAEESLFPEFPSVGDPQRAIDGLADTTLGWLENPAQWSACRQSLARLRQEHGQPGASAAAATAILALRPNQLHCRDVTAEASAVESRPRTSSAA